jgi:hypothetical protein
MRWHMMGNVVLALCTALVASGGCRSGARQPEPSPGAAAPAPKARPVGAPTVAQATQEAQAQEPARTQAPESSLNPFPSTLSALKKNPRALAAAKAAVKDAGYRIDNYGAHDKDGWGLDFHQEYGPFVELGVGEGGSWADDGQGGGSYGTGYCVLLRKTDDGFRQLLGYQDTPGVTEVKKAGITPQEYQKYLMGHFDSFAEWPAGQNGEVESW